jgi:hypothetical protein
MADVVINLDQKQLVKSLLTNCSKDEAFDFIKAIDDHYQEYDFTEKLRDHFAKIIEHEDSIPDAQTRDL